MSRHILAENQIHPAIAKKIGGDYPDTLQEVMQAVETQDVVVVGMAQNPVCKKVRKNLDEAGISYTYLEYGSYLKAWRQRLVIKMWCGWVTFPMVFVKGQLIGGNHETETLLASGELASLLKG